MARWQLLLGGLIGVALVAYAIYSVTRPAATVAAGGPVPPLSAARGLRTATLLPSGQVLVADRYSGLSAAIDGSEPSSPAKHVGETTRSQSANMRR